MNMKNIAHRSIVLKLNRNFFPIGVELVSKTICDLISGVVLALDINYELNDDGTPNFNRVEYFNPVNWDEWMKLKIRHWDFAIHSKNMTIRVPTVVITKNYSKVRFKTFSGKPSKSALFMRDNGRDAYTGEELELDTASIDHVLPLSRGGKDEFSNAVLTTKKINNAKGNKLNSEAGLTLLLNPHHPKPIPISHTIKKSRCVDWTHFLIKH